MSVYLTSEPCCGLCCLRAALDRDQSRLRFLQIELVSFLVLCYIKDCLPERSAHLAFQRRYLLTSLDGTWGWVSAIKVIM